MSGLAKKCDILHFSQRKKFRGASEDGPSKLPGYFLKHLFESRCEIWYIGDVARLGKMRTKNAAFLQMETATEEARNQRTFRFEKTFLEAAIMIRCSTKVRRAPKGIHPDYPYLAKKKTTRGDRSQGSPPSGSDVISRKYGVEEQIVTSLASSAASGKSSPTKRSAHCSAARVPSVTLGRREKWAKNAAAFFGSRHIPPTPQPRTHLRLSHFFS